MKNNITFNHILWLTAFAITTGFFLGSSKYYFFSYDLIEPRAIQYKKSYGLIFPHIIFGLLWVYLSLVQFTRAKCISIKAHKLIGYLTIASAFISSISVLAITLILDKEALFGVRTAGFQRSILTFIFLFAAIYYAKNKNFDNHKKWVMRAFGIAFNNILLRPATHLFGSEAYIQAIQYLELIILFIIIELVLKNKFDKKFNPKYNSYLIIFLIIFTIFITLIMFYITSSR